MKPFPAIRYLPTGTVHYVFASADSGPEDGSLHGFYTLCSREINLERAPNAWEETEDDVTCNTCQRSERAGRDYREAVRQRNINAELIAACEELLRDAEQRPGAYLHADLNGIRIALIHAQEEPKL